MKRIEALFLLSAMKRRCLTLKVMLAETSITLGQFRMAVKRGNICLPYTDSQGSGHVTYYSLSDFLELLIYSEISKHGLPYKFRCGIRKKPVSYLLMKAVLQHLQEISEEDSVSKRCIYSVEYTTGCIDLLTEELASVDMSFIGFNADVLLKKVLSFLYRKKINCIEKNRAL